MGGRPLHTTWASVRDFARDSSESSFSATRLTQQFDLGQLAASKDARWTPVLAIKPDKSIVMAAADKPFTPGADDIVIGH